MPETDDSDLRIPFPEGLQTAAESAESQVIVPASGSLRPPDAQGVFLWWPADLEDWIHPDDLETGQRLVPGCRVFTRRPCDNYADRKLGYRQLVYGHESFRALPILWFPVPQEGYRVGDQVEILSSGGQRQPGIAIIQEMIWNRRQQRIEYLLSAGIMERQRRFLAEEFQPNAPLDSFLNHRDAERIQGRI